MKDLSNENVIHIKKDGMEYLQFRKLLEYDDIVNHAYSLGIDRNYRTVISRDPASEKKRAEAIKNYKDLCNAIDMNYKKLVKPNQSHTKKIQCVAKKINSDEPDFNLEEYKATDGLITNRANIILATTNADCILMIFFDPIKKVVANVHSGWKGTLQRISIEAVNKMQEEYGCNPKDIICCICPSIRKCHFEVHKDVQEPYYEEFKKIEGIDKIIEPISEDKWTIDTVEINKIILQQFGLKEENIIDCGICSVCNSDLVHSYRAEKEGYGLSTAIIGLK